MRNLIWVIIFSFLIASCSEQDGPEIHQEAKWIWHPELSEMASNQFTYFKKSIDYQGEIQNPVGYFTADANARLSINGEIVRRKVTRYHPDKVRPEKIDLDRYLKNGHNEILVLHHNWGDIKNFQRDEIRRAGLYFYSPDIPSLNSNQSWQVAKAKHFAEHQQQIIGVIGDLRIRFPLILDGNMTEAPLDWVGAVPVNNGPWQISYDYSPHPQREQFKHVKSVIAAGKIKYPSEFKTDIQSQKNDINFPRYMQEADYIPTDEIYEKFDSGNANISIKAGETIYVTYDFHVPIHGFPSFELESDSDKIAISLGYSELNVSLYDGSHHTDAETGWIKTEGVVGPFYGDRYITKKGSQSVEIPEERTARYMTVHFTAVEDANIKLGKMGIVKSQYPVDWVGSFDADDPIMDQIIQLSKIHAEITMSDVYIDTPGREDGQWLEDIRLRALLSESWVNDIDLRYLTLAHSQESDIDGKFLSFAPQSFIELTNWDWGMQWITMLHDHLKWKSVRGDDDTIETAKFFGDALVTYVNLLLDQLNNDGLFASKDVFADIRVGDHPISDDDVSVITHSWLIERLKQAIEIASYYKIEGADIEKWQNERDRMIASFHEFLVVEGELPYAGDTYYPASDELKGKSQAAQLSAIEAGLFSDEHATNILVHFFSGPNGKAQEGITPWNNPTYLYRALKRLSDHGLGNRALEHFKWRLSPYLPGAPDNITPLKLQGPYGGPLPEYFVRHEDIGLSPTEINTAQPADPTGSHGWAAVGMVWLHDSMLGVTWGNGGFGDQTLSIEPNLYGYDAISGDVMTPHGKVHVKLNNDELTVSLPDSVTARIKSPFKPDDYTDSNGETSITIKAQP